MSAATLLAFPVLCTIVAWALGRVLLGVFRAGRWPDAMAVFVGLAGVLAVVSVINFAGFGTRVALPVLALAAALAAALGRRHLVVADRGELLLSAGIAFAAYLHYTWPMLAQAGSTGVMMYPTDYSHYVGVAKWLQLHSIEVPAQFGAATSPVELSVGYHQELRLRLGALMLLGLLADAAGSDVPRLFSLYSGFLLGLQALAVSLLAQRIAPGQPKWVPALAGLLYALSPTATWALYAGFVPQAIGLAFLLAAVVMLLHLVDDAAAAQRPWRERFTMALPAGLLLFANWACYPEGFPLGILVVGSYVLLSQGRRLLAADFWRALLPASGGLLAGWVLASPENFWWGLEGLVIQLGGTPHGGEQAVGPWPLFAMAIGAMEQPLFPQASAWTGSWFQLASAAACVFAGAGLAWLLARRERALPLAILLSAAFLFFYVAHAYSFARQGHLPTWRALYTWNLFKAATFASPFLVACAVVGWTSLGQRLARGAGLPAAAAVLALAVLAVVLRQDLVYVQRLSHLRISPELRTLLAGVPEGRLLVDVHGRGTEFDYYQRNAIYGVLPARPFVSTQDWQPPHLDPAKAVDHLRDKRDFLREPFAYVLTDRPERYPSPPVVARAGAYVLLDVRRKDFVFTLQRDRLAPFTVLNAAAAAAPRAVAYDAFNLAAGRVSFDASESTRVAAIPGGGRAGLQVPVPAAGGLVQLRFDPAPTAPPLLLARGAAGEGPGPAIDLQSRILDETISASGPRQRMTLQRVGDVVQLEMPEAGTSRALVAREVEAGDYLLHVQTGVVQVADRAPSGYGAFLGPENDFGNSIELQPQSSQYLRVSVRTKGPVLLSLGFGGWGKARGTLQIRRLELLRIPGA